MAHDKYQGFMKIRTLTTAFIFLFSISLLADDFFEAGRRGDLEHVQFLIGSESIDVNIPGKLFGRTLLHEVSFQGHLPLVIYLVNDAKADIHAWEKSGYTPIHLAAMGGHPLVVEFLLSKGADVNAWSYLGTPLHQAAHYGHAPVAKILLKHKDINIHQKDGRGYTALYWAAHYEHLEVTRALLIAGAEIDNPKHWRQSVLDRVLQIKEEVKNAEISCYN